MGKAPLLVRGLTGREKPCFMITMMFGVHFTVNYFFDPHPHYHKYPLRDGIYI
jgi:hypothetical protein